MNTRIFQVDEYTIEVNQDGTYVEVIARTQDENGKALRSCINNVNGIMSWLLEDIPTDEDDNYFERFEDSSWECEDESEAKAIYNSACGLFESAEMEGVTHDCVVSALAEDRAEGEWLPLGW